MSRPPGSEAGPAAPPPGDRFVWHPRYQGRTAEAVRAEIRTELTSDQRAYALALEGAEDHEGDTLTSVVALERKWGPFDLDWAETDPAALADRIVAFEQERERRRDLIPFAAFRDELGPAPHVRPAAGGAATSRPLLIAILALVVLAIAVWLLLG